MDADELTRMMRMPYKHCGPPDNPIVIDITDMPSALDHLYGKHKYRNRVNVNPSRSKRAREAIKLNSGGRKA